MDISAFCCDTTGHEIHIGTLPNMKRPSLLIKYPNDPMHYKVATFNGDFSANAMIEFLMDLFGKLDGTTVVYKGVKE